MKKVIAIVLSALTVLCIFASCGSSSKNLIETKDVNENKTLIGNGEITFTWEITGEDGEIRSYNVASNEKSLADVLSSYGLATFDEKEISINGFELPEGAKWIFGINGEKTRKAPADITIENGAIYSFVMDE